MLQQPNVLLLSTDETEMAALEWILCRDLILTPVHSVNELIDRLENGSYDALFCAWSFQTGTWNDVLQEVLIHAPDLPTIILGKTNDEKEWMEVLDAGAFDLLVPPYGERRLLAVLEQASSSREARASRALVRT